MGSYDEAHPPTLQSPQLSPLLLGTSLPLVSDNSAHLPAQQSSQLSLSQTQPTNASGFFSASSDIQINGGQFNLINTGKQQSTPTFSDF